MCNGGFYLTSLVDNPVNLRLEVQVVDDSLVYLQFGVFPLRGQLKLSVGQLQLQKARFQFLEVRLLLQEDFRRLLQKLVVGPPVL